MRLNKRILQNLLPGLLPLFIFILADELWGTIIGLYVAIGFGVIELFFTYIRSGKFEKFILIDIGLLVILGGISIALENEIFFKLKPALIELIFAAILAFSAFGKRNFIYEMSMRYIRDVQISPLAERKLNQSLKVLFYLTLIHIILVLYSAFFMSTEAWGFISGVLFYLLILGYFGFEILRERIKRKKMNYDEILPVVDLDGILRGTAPRKDCHFNPKEKLLHPVVHMHVFDYSGKILLQHRPKTKEVQPDKWDTAVGGHISYGETIEEALTREAREELGLTGFKAQFVEKYLWETEVEKELVFTFICQTSQDIITNKEEVTEAKFWKLTDVRKMLGKNQFTPNFENEFARLEKRGMVK